MFRHPLLVSPARSCSARFPFHPGQRPSCPNKPSRSPQSARIHCSRRARCRSARRPSTGSRTPTSSRRSKPACRRELEEIAAIADNPAAPTFENTLVALEKTGQLLGRVSLVFNGLDVGEHEPGAAEGPAGRRAETRGPGGRDLPERRRCSSGSKPSTPGATTLKLDPESLRLVEYYYQRFVRAGARLSDADKAKLRALNEQDAALSAKYISQLLAAAKDAALVVGDAAELAGLSKDEIEAAAAGGEGARPRRQVADPAAEHHAAADAAVARRTARRARSSSARRGRAPSAATPTTPGRSSRRWPSLRARKAGAARLSELRGVGARRPDGEDARRPSTSSSARLIPPATANARAEARDIQALIDQQRGGVHARAVGLGLLRRAGAQGEVRPRRRGARAVLRARPRAP